MSYILIADDEPDILDMLELISTTTTQAPVYKASSGQDALVIVKQHGSPSLIISDYKMPNGDGVFLLTEVQKLYPGIPFIVCSGNPREQLAELFPTISEFIQKPNMMKPLKDYLQKNFIAASTPKEYVQIPLGYLRRLGFVSFDTYVRLNEGKYLRLHQAGDALDDEDYLKIENKFLNRLYLLKDDALTVIKEFEEYLSKRIFTPSGTQAESEIVDDIIPSVALLCKRFGWSEESLQLAQKTVTATIQFVKKNKALSALLRVPTNNDPYSSHVSRLSVLTCVVASNLGWHNESTHEKLVMASLLHDHFVDESKYEKFEQLKGLNSNPSGDQAYRAHPLKAAELARSIKGIPSNVDSIIMEHHERPGGDGFPRGLSSNRISALGALFIICEELITYSHQRELELISMDDFIKSYPEFLQKDPFKKIMTSFKNRG
jgi:response regulator RpfG family c-di-GMP phosphodiesterase